jgi:hypothetical protein
MTDQLSTDLDSYTSQDLFNILNLEDDASQYEIEQAANSVISTMKNNNNQDLVNFFDKVKDRLLTEEDNSYQASDNDQDDETTDVGNVWNNEYFSQTDTTQTDNYTTRKQAVGFFEENGHTPMIKERLGVQQTHNVDVAQGTMNPLLRTTTTRVANVDSQYRPNILPYSENNPDSVASATNFTINLSEPLLNVISITLYSVQIPYTWYIFDQNLGNTCFWINTDGSDILINIESGNYTASSLIDEINDTIAVALDASSAPFLFTYIETSNKVSVICEEDCSANLIFYSNDLKYTCGDSCSVAVSINHTLGWILGFRPASMDDDPFEITLASDEEVISSSVMDIYGSKYFLLVLDDYNTSHLNKGLVNITDTATKLDVPSYYHKGTTDSSSTSTFLDCTEKTVPQIQRTAPRTLTRAQILTVNNILKDRATSSNRIPGPNPSDVFALLPLSLDRDSTNSYIVFGSDLQFNKREYFGPVDIERITARLVDDKGNTVNLHGADWSFSFIVEQLYQF